MRIGIDACDMVAEHLTGIEYSLTQLVRNLPAAGGDHEYALYFNFVRQDYEARFEARVRPLLGGKMQARVCRVPNRLMQIARERLHVPIDWFIGECDVVHYPSFVTRPQRSGARVVTIHDLMPLTHAAYYPARDRATFAREVRRSLRSADAIIAVSDYTKRALATHCGVEESRVFVVHHGVDACYTVPAPDAVKAVAARYRLPSRYVLFVGTEEPRKNVPALVRAARLWREAGCDDIALVLAGKRAWGSDEIDATIESCGLADAVLRLGRVDAADLPAVYGGATAFVLPSTAEGFGMPLVEAMACGTPVVASDTTALPEVVDDAGLLFDPARPAALAGCVVRIARDASLREALRARGLARARTFTWEATAQRTLSAYEAAVRHAHSVRGKGRGRPAHAAC